MISRLGSSYFFSKKLAALAHFAAFYYCQARRTL